MVNPWAHEVGPHQTGRNHLDGYGPANPHPGHGKDPNIMNEFGHTVYPKWIDVKGERMVANDAKHERELLKAADWSAPKEKV